MGNKSGKTRENICNVKVTLMSDYQTETCDTEFEFAAQTASNSVKLKQKLLRVSILQPGKLPSILCSEFLIERVLGHGVLNSLFRLILQSKLTCQTLRFDRSDFSGIDSETFRNFVAVTSHAIEELRVDNCFGADLPLSITDSTLALFQNLQTLKLNCPAVVFTDVTDKTLALYAATLCHVELTQCPNVSHSGVESLLRSWMTRCTDNSQLTNIQTVVLNDCTGVNLLALVNDAWRHWRLTLVCEAVEGSESSDGVKTIKVSPIMPELYANSTWTCYCRNALG